MKSLAVALLAFVFLAGSASSQRPCPAFVPQSPQMNPPSEVKIGSDRWKITLLKREILVDRTVYVGWTIDAQYAIDELPPELRKKRRLKEILLVTRDIDPIELRMNMIHELQHAVVGTTRSTEKKTVHQYVQMSADGWTRVLLDNPDLYRWLGMQ